MKLWASYLQRKECNMERFFITIAVSVENEARAKELGKFLTDRADEVALDASLLKVESAEPLQPDGPAAA